MTSDSNWPTPIHLVKRLYQMTILGSLTILAKWNIANRVWGVGVGGGNVLPVLANPIVLIE